MAKTGDERGRSACLGEDRVWKRREKEKDKEKGTRDGRWRLSLEVK